MTQFTIGAIEVGDEREAAFEDFLDLTLGHSIVSAAVSDNHLELGISGGRMLRLFPRGAEIKANVLSTLNPDDIPPLTVRIADAPRDLTVRAIETRLGGLRRLHALARLDDAGRWDDIRKALDTGARDLDDLLDERDQLFIQSASTGSWYVTLWCKARESYQALVRIVSIVFERGRESLLRKAEAEADLKELEVDERRFRLGVAKSDYILKLLKRLPAGESRRATERFVLEAVRDALGPGASGEDVTASSRRLLGPKSATVNFSAEAPQPTEREPVQTQPKPPDGKPKRTKNRKR